MKLACMLRTLEETLSAAAFAEENEHQTALEMLRQQTAERKTACETPVGNEKRLLTPAV